MRYTRYDMKKKKKSKTYVFIVFLVLIFAFLIGSMLWKFVVKTNTMPSIKTENVKNTDKKGAVKDDSSKSQSINEKTIKFIVVQGGIYANKSNAEQQKSELSKYGCPFMIDENGKTRVCLGVYNEERGNNIIKSLKEQNVDSSKITFVVSNNELCDTEIIEILNADIQILNKLSEKDVKAIKTEELKKWCSSLKKVSSGKNIDTLKDLTTHINKLPKEISKDKAQENYLYMYNTLKKISEKQ